MKELKYSLKHLIVQAVLLVILSAILFYFQNIIGTLAFIASAFMIVHQYTYINNKNKRLRRRLLILIMSLRILQKMLYSRFLFHFWFSMIRIKLAGLTLILRIWLMMRLRFSIMKSKNSGFEDCKRQWR